MKANIKTIGIILAVVLALVEIYLVSSSIVEKSNQSNETKIYCNQKCNYNAPSLMWEFSGDNYARTRGFTTENECLSYCSQVKEGFAYYIKNAYASVFNAFGSLFKK